MTEPKRWTPSEVYHHAVNSDRFVAAADFDRLRDERDELRRGRPLWPSAGYRGEGFLVGDLTPEETLRAASVPTVDEYTCEEGELYVPLSVALAAVAAERERQLGAREGDTTGSNEHGSHT